MSNSNCPWMSIMLSCLCCINLPGSSEVPTYARREGYFKEKLHGTGGIHGIHRIHRIHKIHRIHGICRIHRTCGIHRIHMCRVGMF